MLRVGVIGLGAIGREHLDIYRNLPGVRLTAVADANATASSSLASELGVESFGSTTELLAAGLVDAVSLCTPDDIHYQDALEILEAGVHLLLEKPIATRPEEADHLVKAAEASGLTVMPGHTLRFEPKYLTARRLVESGHIDAVTWIAGHRVTAVQAMETTQRTSDGNQAVAVTANLRLDNGGVIQLEAAWGLPGDFPTDIDARLRLVADRGELSIDIHEQGIRAFGDALGYPVPVATPMYGKTQGALHRNSTPSSAPYAARSHYRSPCATGPPPSI
jgi:predicted dehydrogenase